MHKYKEPEFQTSLLSPRTLLVLFSNWLLPRQSQRSCKYPILFSSKKLWEKKKLWAENTQILHRLQISLTNASFSGLSFSKLNSTLLHQILICKTYILLLLYQSWNTFRIELADKGPYKTSIGSMRLKLQKLKESNSQAQKVRAKDLQESWEDIKEILHYQDLFFILETIQTKLISRRHDDPLAGRFGIEKTWQLITRKYY